METLGNRLVGMNNLAEKGHRERSRGDDLGKEEEEHCQGEQDGDGQGDLVAKSENVHAQIRLRKVKVFTFNVSNRIE